MCIPKCNLFSMHNATCRYGFRTDFLGSDNQLVCSSMGNATSPNLSLPELHIVFLCGVETPWAFFKTIKKILIV